MRYGIYFVSADNIDINDEDFGYQMVRDCSHDHWLGNDTHLLLTNLVNAINRDEVNTENGYIYITDELEGIILN